MGAESRQRGAVSWPALVTIAMFLAAVALIVQRALHLTHGAWVYPLDDAFIHMAIARSFALHGVWGLTPDGFTSSTSSPLWTFLLAGAFKLFGVRVIIPFVLSCTLGVAVILMLDRLLRAHAAPAPWRLLVLLLSGFAGPLPALAFSGMEHMLHILVTLMVLNMALRVLGPSPARRDAALLVGACFFLTLCRYEGLFLIFALASLLVLRGRRALAAASAAGGMLPLAVYGAISRAHGWYWLPNSVLLKGRGLHGPLKAFAKSLLNSGFNQLWANPQVLVVLLASLSLLLIPRRSNAGRENRDVLTMFVVVLLLHMQFAQAGWFYRYEAYLICIGVVLIGAGLWIERERLRSWFWESPRFPRFAAAAVLLVMVARPLGDRAVRSWQESPIAAANINGQQVQMARFLNRYYAGRPVMVNDIGAVAFFGDEHVLDIWGLASLEPARLTLTHRWSSSSVDQLVRDSGAKVGIVYEDWFGQWGGILPPTWTRLGAWKIPRNVACAFDSVTIFSLTASETEPLTQHLREFETSLPPEVMRSGRYRETP